MGLRFVGLMPCSLQCWHGPKAPKHATTAPRANNGPYGIPNNNQHATTILSAMPPALPTAIQTVTAACQQCKQKQLQQQQQQQQDQVQRHQQQHVNCFMNSCQTHGLHNNHCGANHFTTPNASTAAGSLIALPSITVPPPPLPPMPTQQSQSIPTFYQTTSAPINGNANYGNAPQLLISNAIPPTCTPGQTVMPNMCSMMAAGNATATTDTSSQAPTNANNSMVLLPFSLPGFVSTLPAPTAATQSARTNPNTPTKQQKQQQPQLQQQQQQQYQLQHHCPHVGFSNNAAKSTVLVRASSQSQQRSQKATFSRHLVLPLKVIAANAISNYQKSGKLPATIPFFNAIDDLSQSNELDEEGSKDQCNPTTYAVVQRADKESAFVLAIEPIEKRIVVMINLYGVRQYKDDWNSVDIITLRAYYGLLILAGVYRSDGECLSELWDDQHGRSIFDECMSLVQFKKINQFLWFDDKEQRERDQDKLAPTRFIFVKWVLNNKKLYCLGDFAAVDEQFLPFRGRSTLKKYIPPRPAKYGIKLWICADAKTSFSYNLQVYTGRDRNCAAEINQDGRVVLEMTEGTLCNH